MTQPASRVDWLLFLVLGVIWGSSFLFIKIGVEAGLQPLTLVMLRLALGTALLAVVIAASRVRLPREPRTYGHLVVMGLIAIALPFTLITWAEQTVDSTVASVINGGVPLFVIPIAAIFLHDEPVTPNRLAGIGIGFAGVAILVGFDPARLAGGDLAGELAIVGATISYAAGGVYARRSVRGLPAIVPAFFQVGFALVIVSVLALAFERPLHVPLAIDAVVSVLWLGLLGSGVAYVIFFRLLGRWGAARTSLVTYLMPVVGLVMGASVLGEPIDGRLLVGAGLVIGGIALVNSRIGARPLWVRSRPASVKPSTPA
jgi:drug/metabolite transporter (DMT)-like permease